MGIQTYFEVPDLAVNEEVFGRGMKLDGHEAEILISIHRSASELNFVGLGEPVVGTGENVRASAAKSGTSTRAWVTLSGRPVQVAGPIGVNVARLEEFSVEEFRSLPKSDGEARCTQLIYAYLKLADDAARSFVEWVRVSTGQTWLSPTGYEFPRLLSAARVTDWDASIEFGPYIGRPGVLRVIPDESLLDVDDLSRVARLSRTGPPGFAALALADALHWADDLQRSSSERAVVFAAMACESRIKEVARGVANSEQRPLVDFVLDNYRDVPQGPPQLMHKFLESINGRSLHADDPDTFRQVTRLFTTRNSIVHRGRSVERKEAKNLIDGAAKVLKWLDDVAGAR